MIKTILSVVLLCSFVSAQYAVMPARKISAEKGKSNVTYHMEHPLHDFESVSNDISCNISFDDRTNTIQQVGVSIPVKSFDSQNNNRDSHALEVLEAIKYPKVTFLSSTIEQNGDILTIAGILTFHGVSQPITFRARQEDDNKSIRVTGEFSVQLSEYNVERPSLMFIPVKDKMKISFHIVFPKIGF